MPNYLRLKDRTTSETYEGRRLIEIDERLCAALGVPVDPEQFYENWVDWWPLYSKDNWNDVRAWYSNGGYDNSKGWVDRRLRVIDWLSEHYDLDSYATIGKR